MEKEVKISREFSFILDENGKTEEIRHYRNEKLVARYGSVYDENGNVIGVRQLRVEDVAPLSLLEKVKKSIWKKPEKLDYLNWIGVINFIGTINRVNKVKTIEEILEILNVKNIDNIGTLGQLTLVKSIEKILSVRETRIKNVPTMLNSGFEAGDFTGYFPMGCEIRSAFNFTGQYACYIPDTSAITYVEQILEIPVEVKYIRDLNVVGYGKNAMFNDSTLRFTVYYTDGSTDVHDFTVSLGSWTSCDMLPYLDQTKILRGVKVKCQAYAPMYIDDFILLSSEPRVITGIKGLETIVEERAGEIGADVTEVMLDRPKEDCTLEVLHFASTSQYNGLWIEPYKKDGTLDQPFGIIETTGALINGSIQPITINTEKSSIWEELNYDEATKYKFGLKRPIRFSNGVKISIFNPGTGSEDTACQFVVRIEGE